MRKPDPAIFTHTLDLLGGIAPERAVFLDDVEGNLVGRPAGGPAHDPRRRPAGPALLELDLLLGRAEPPG